MLLNIDRVDIEYVGRRASAGVGVRPETPVQGSAEFIISVGFR